MSKVQMSPIMRDGSGDKMSKVVQQSNYGHLDLKYQFWQQYRTTLSVISSHTNESNYDRKQRERKRGKGFFFLDGSGDKMS